MKKIFMTLCAAAALVACSKTEVQYENPAEIGFAPAVMNVTKAAMGNGTLLALNPDQKLGIWAYWNYKDGVQQDGHSEVYLDDATFAKKTVTYSSGEVTAWGGDGVAYPWPTNGTLIFAGYTKPSAEADPTVTARYNRTNREVTFENYTPKNGYDLCWFCDNGEYNYRTSNETIKPTLHHALSWLTFTVKGEGTTVGWKLNKIELDGVATTGTGVCNKDGVADWSFGTDPYVGKLPLLSSELTLTNGAVDIENEAKNILVLPQEINPDNQQGTARTQHTLKISYSYLVGSVEKTDTKVVNLDLNTANANIPNEWESGKHYTYNLTFKANEILVSPIYGQWGDGGQQGIVIE